MTAFPTPRTWTNTGISASDLNTDLRDGLKNLDERLALHGITSESALNKVKTAKVGCLVTGSSTQSLSDSTATNLTWDTETWDTDAFHSTAGNTNRITIPSGFDGLYLITFGIQFVANATGERRILVADDAGTVLARQGTRAVATGVTDVALSFVWELAAGDWITAQAYQSSGGALNADKSASSSMFSAVRLSSS